MGRRATGYVVESLDGTVSIPLPTLTECKDIPNDRDEVPTPSAARHHDHLKSIAHLTQELDSNAQILMLLGRDIVRVHKVRKQISGPHNAPYAQKLVKSNARVAHGSDAPPASSLLHTEA